MSTLTEILGGIANTHPAAELFPILVAPSLTGKEKNKIRMDLIPVACWKLNDVRFAFASSFVLPNSRSEFLELAALRRQHPGAPLSVFGHADPTGDEGFNKTLSGHRAEAIYAVLTRNTAMWERLCTAAGSSEGWGQPAVQSMVQALGHPTVTSFQKEQGLFADGIAGPITRSKLFPAYMNFLCPDTFAASDFLGGGQDALGKGDYQGCGEFNPAMVFSASEFASLSQPSQKSRRDEENSVSRRVMVLLFRPGSQVAVEKWPCPRTREGIDACRRRFWSDGEQRRAPQAHRREFRETKDTFACRFYHRLTVASPCEGINPAPALEEVGPLIQQVAAPEPQSEAPAAAPAQKSSLVGDKVQTDTAPVPASEPDSPAMTGPDFGFVMVRKNKFVARQIFRLVVDKAFDGQGVLTITPADKIEFFRSGGDGKTPLSFSGGNVFSGAELSAPGGVLLFAEGKTASLAKDDIKLTLTLSGGTKKIKGPATIKLTSVELTLDICHPPKPNQAPAPLPMPDKQTKGARVFVQGDPPSSRRAVLIVRQPKPANLNHDLLLHTLSGRVETFAAQTPAKGQTPLPAVIKIKSSSIPSAGKQFFVEGRFASKVEAEETYHLGIGTGVMGAMMNDSVALTVAAQSWIGKVFYNRTWDHDTSASIAAVKEFLPFNKVEVFGKTPGAAKETLVATTFLEEDGKFAFTPVPELDSAFIRVYLEHKDNKVARVRGQVVKGSSTPVNTPAFQIRANQTVSFDQTVDPAAFKNKSGEINLGDFEAANPHFAMYCDAYKSVWFGHKRLLELTGGEADAPLCNVNVPQPTDSTSMASNQMWLLESDVQDRDVILHEYGHFIGNHFLQGLGNLGYGYNDDPAPGRHGPNVSHPWFAEHYESTWDEGYATFFSCALRDKPTYRDGHEGAAGTSGFGMDLTANTPQMGAHNECAVQEVLWDILKVKNIPFKTGFWKAFMTTPKALDAYSFFDNWKKAGCPDVAKVIDAYKSRRMDFGYRYPEGSEMFTCVPPAQGFDAGKKQFATVAQLFAAFGNEPGNTSGTLAAYEEEFYNRNRAKNPGMLGPGSAATVGAGNALTFTINLVQGRRYIVPRRFQIKP
ncbi:MAG TPA: OmpA family protein [Bryobacteraceae bacterium]|nr:OmpA family protein [Bryobacteraceae bacterium]